MRAAGLRVSLSRRSWGVIEPLALYLLVAFLFFGLRLLTGHGSSYVGNGRDQEVFIWAFAWLPHAILHGENPFVTHAVWAPSGVNLTWATAVPGLALLFSPLTLTAGAFTSYNVAVVLMPALAAWTAFLLCRYLTGQLWPSLVGGYLFGFSSYMLGQELGHIHVSSVFLIPLVALVVLRYVRGELDESGLVVRLGPLLALQLLFTTEIAFTLTLALACSIAIGIVVAPGIRRRLVKLLAPLAVSYLLAAILTAPFLYYLLAGFQTGGVHPQQLYVTDLVNFAVPTRLSLAGLGWAHSIAHHFPGNDSERGAYLGVPTLLIIGLFAWQRRRTAGGRFLVVALLVAALATLGAELTIDGKTSLPLPWGRGIVPLPWEHLGYLPLFNNVLVERLSLYVAFAAALMVSLWTAGRRRGALRLLLPALAILAIVPDPGAGVWATTYTVPPLFTSSTFRSCLDPHENILPLPVNNNGNSNLWQVASDFRFTMAGGYVLEHPPEPFVISHPIAVIALGFPVPAREARFLRSYIREKHVTSVIVDEAQTRYWAAALNKIAAPHHVGGVLLYRVDKSGTRCPG